MRVSYGNLLVLPIVLIFLAVNVTLISLPIPLFSFASDIVTQERWGDFTLSHPIGSLYAQSMTDYPPLYLYVLYFNGWLNFQNHSAQPGAPSYLFISKMVPLLCDLLIGLLLFFTLRKGGVKKAIVGLSLYLFNPAIMFNTSYWGQVDSVYTIFLLLSVKYLTDRRYFISTVFASVAVLTKMQALFFLPVLGLVLISNLNVKRILGLIVADVAIIFAIMSPFISVAQNVAYTMIKNFGQYPYVTMNALNLWFLLFSYSVPEFLECMRDTYTIYGISLKMVGYLALGIYTALVLYQVRKGNMSIALGSASLAFASFMLPTEIHERYLFPFFALFLFVALEKREQVGIYAALTLTYLLNLMLVVNFSGFYGTFYLIQSFLRMIIQYWSLSNVTLAIAALNVTIFMYFSLVSIFGSLIKNLKNDLLLLNQVIIESLRRFGAHTPH